LNDVPKSLKWGIGGLLAVVLAFFALPIIATMVWNAVSIVAGLAVLGVMYLALPAAAEWCAQGSYWLYSKAISTNPVTKLWRDFKEFLEEIEKVQENINLVATEEEAAKAELARNKSLFDAAEIMGYQEDIDQITEAKCFLMDERDRLKTDAEQMRKDIKKNEAHWKMGNALVRASKAVDKASGIAVGTEGGKIAISTIQNRLAEGRARLNVLRSSRSADSIRQAMAERKKAQTTDVMVKPSPALSNNPSVSLQAVRVVEPRAVIKTPSPDKNQSLLDRI
jgi:hypothetical protein